MLASVGKISITKGDNMDVVLPKGSIVQPQSSSPSPSRGLIKATNRSNG